MTNPLVRLLRSYVTDYVNRQDFSVLPDIMHDDYTLFTGDYRIAGRDGDYRAAVARQLRQFPGLMFTPHELLVSGDAIAVRFSEHGASIVQEGRRAAWAGIGIYTMAGKRLASCQIEQDYMGRRRQLTSGAPAAVDPPAIAPWDSKVETPSPANEEVVQNWLGTGNWLELAEVRIDDSHVTGERRRLLDPERFEMLQIMSGGDRVAFRGRHLGRSEGSDDEAWLHLSGLVRVANGEIAGGHVIRDREGLRRRQKAIATAGGSSVDAVSNEEEL